MRLHAHNQNCKPWRLDGIYARNLQAGEVIEWRGFELSYDPRQEAYMVAVAAKDPAYVNARNVPVYYPNAPFMQFGALACALGYIKGAASTQLVGAA